MNIDKFSCLDRLNIACTRGSFIFSSLISSNTVIPPSSYSWGNFNSYILSYVSLSESDFSKSLSLTISWIITSLSSSLGMFGIMLTG